jgi:hypothetical protein
MGDVFYFILKSEFLSRSAYKESVLFLGVQWGVIETIGPEQTLGVRINQYMHPSAHEVCVRLLGSHTKKKAVGGFWQMGCRHSGR